MSYHSLFLEHCYWFFDHKVSVQSASIGEVSAYCSVNSRSRAELTWHVQSNNLKQVIVGQVGAQAYTEPMLHLNH